MSNLKIDLDALEPKKGEITIGGEVYEVNHPKTSQLLKMMSIFQTFQDSMKTGEVEKTDDEALKLNDAIKEIIPQIGDRVLVFGQLMAISTMLLQMAMPNQLEELESRGITVEAVKKNQ